MTLLPVRRMQASMCCTLVLSLTCIGCGSTSVDPDGETAQFSQVPPFTPELMREVSLTDETAVAVVQFFDDFTSALSVQKAERLKPYFDTRITLCLLRNQFLVAPTIGRNESKLVRSLDQSVSHQITDADNGYGWKEIDIRKLHMMPDQSLAIVYARQKNSNGLVSRMRWWLFNTDLGWKAYDFELLDDSIPYSVKLGVGFKMGAIDDPQALHVPPLMTAIESGLSGDAHSASLQLTQLATVPFIPVFEAMRLEMLAKFCAADLQPSSAIEAALASRQLAPYRPVNSLSLASSYSMTGDFDQARRELEQYVKMIEEDASYYAVKGDLALAEGNRQEAQKCYQLGLADDAQGGWNTYGLLQISPPGERQELLPAYAKLDPSKQWFAQFARRAMAQQDWQLLSDLINLQQIHDPDHSDLPRFQYLLSNRPTEQETQ